MHKFKKIWITILHFYLGDTKYTTSDSWQKKSDFVATTISTNIFLWIYAALAYFTIDIPSLWIVCYLFAILNLLSPLLCRFTTPIVAAHFGMFFGTTQIATIVYFTGGYQSEIIGLMGFVPLVGGLASGKPGIKIWAPVALLIICFFWGLSIYGIDLKIFQNQFGQEINRILFLFTCLTLSTAIMLAHLITLEAKEELLKGQSAKIKNLLRVLLHDFTTPIAVIGGTVKLQLKDELPLAAKEGFLQISKYSRIIEEIIKSAKQLYLASHENKAVELEPVEIEDSVVRVLTLLEENIQAKNLQINLGTIPRYPIVGLKTIFEFQILQNVLTNAIKFTPKGGVIDIFGYEKSSKIGVIVQDTGTGMSHTEITNLFSNTFPPSKKGTEGEFGTGFGLLIMKHYLDIFNAEVRIISVATGPNTGTKFELIFQKYVLKK